MEKNKKLFLKFIAILLFVIFLAFFKIMQNIFYIEKNKAIELLEKEKFVLYNQYFVKYIEYQELKEKIDFNLLSKKLNMVPTKKEDFIHIFIDFDQFIKYFNTKKN